MPKMFCTNCGHELDEDAAFCTECGTPIASATSDETTVLPHEDTTQVLDSASAAPDKTRVAPAPAPTPASANPINPEPAPSPSAPPAPRPTKRPVGLIVVIVALVAAIAALVVLFVVPSLTADKTPAEPAEVAETEAAETKEAKTEEGESDEAETEEAEDVSKEAETREPEGDAQAAHSADSSTTGGYILFDSDSYYYKTSQLEYLSNYELYLARNEIYARHGRIFNNEDLQHYFGSKSWYTPKIAPEDFDDATMLNDYEKSNRDTIRDLEQSRNSPYLK